jgi:pyruvate kinase
LIEPSLQQTKVIWSFEAQVLDQKLVEKVSSQKVDAIRIVYDRDHEANILSFLELYKAPSNLNQAPIMLDISSWTQAVYGGKEPLEVAFGSSVTLTTVGGGGDVEIETALWGKIFGPSSLVYFGFGQVVAKVTNLGKDLVELEIMQGGEIRPGMDVYIPDTRYHTELRNIQVADLERFSNSGVDYLVIPSKWSAEVIKNFRSDLRERFGEATPWFLAKVDSSQSYDNLEHYLPAVNGIMISRREMALTMNPASVPMVTKEIIQACNDKAKVVCTASEMLASMRFNATPTRAEVSDVANAVLDGADAVILSEEVSSGTYGVEAIEIMRQIVIDIESQSHLERNWKKSAPEIVNEMDAITYGAYTTARRVGAKAIVCITKDGNTALRLASFRIPIPVIAVTFSSETRDRLRLVRGVQTIYLDMAPKIDNVLPTVNDILLKGSWLKAGDPIIFVAVTLSSISESASNLFSIQRLYDH